MKRKVIAFFASALMMPCLAEEVPALLVKTSATELEVSLTDIGKVTYTETDMVVVMKDGSTRSFAMDDIVSMRFTSADPSAIGTTTAGINGKEAIYTVDGVRTAKANNKGIYIIKVEKETRKVAK